MSQDLLPNFDTGDARRFLENSKRILLLGNQAREASSNSKIDSSKKSSIKSEALKDALQNPM